MSKYKYLLCLSVATVLLSFPSLAAYAAEPKSLEQLLSDLKAAQPENVVTLEREIERRWSLSGSYSVDLLFQKGEDAFKAKDFEAAIEHFSAVIEFAPEFAMGWFARSRAFMAVDYDGPALEDLERALQIDAQNYLAILALAQMFEYLGHSDLALAAYEEVLNIHPHLNAARESKARLDSRLADQNI